MKVKFLFSNLFPSLSSLKINTVYTFYLSKFVIFVIFYAKLYEIWLYCRLLLKLCAHTCLLAKYLLNHQTDFNKTHTV